MVNKKIKNMEEYYRNKIEVIADIICELQTLSKDKVSYERIKTDLETWEGSRFIE